MAKGSVLYRVHQQIHKPWHFASDGLGRFDLGLPAGTCYWATEPLGAFMEVFRDVAMVSEEAVMQRAISRHELTENLRLADCTSARARRFGLTAAIHAADEYEKTQAWAAAWAEHGFDGVLYYASHDPSLELCGVAIFGPRGASEPSEAGPPYGSPIPWSICDEAEERFDVRVRPTPMTPSSALRRA